jgi:hypothetical protein
MASTNTDSTLEIRLDSMRTATVGDLTMFHPKDSHGPSALESEQISSEYVSEINFSRKHHQAPFSLENINSHQRQRIHRPLSIYTSLGSPLRPVGSGRLRSVSLGNVNTCLQSRSVPNSPGQFHHEQRPYQQGYYGGPSAFGGLLIPQPSPSSNKDDDGMDTTSDAADVIPPELSDQRKAMEAACAAERVRAKQREMEEQNMTADELRMVLKKERLRTGKIKSDLVALRYGAVQNQLQAEVLEEGRINGLMRRMDLLQEEKGRILLELEREEEMVCKLFVDIPLQ